jgi:hypothetical protein
MNEVQLVLGFEGQRDQVKCKICLPQLKNTRILEP